VLKAKAQEQTIHRDTEGTEEFVLKAKARAKAKAKAKAKALSLRYAALRSG
jgi:hypothetical protein